MIRYDPNRDTDEMTPDDNGEYVRYADVVGLRALLSELAGSLMEATENCATCGSWERWCSRCQKFRVVIDRASR